MRRLVGLFPADTIDLARTSRATTIGDIYASDLSVPTAGPAGLAPGVGAGFQLASAPALNLRK